MRNILLVVCLNTMVIATSVLAKDPPASAEKLRSQLEFALKAKDTNAIQALFNKQGVSEEMKSMDTGMFDEFVKPAANIKSVTLQPLPAGMQLTSEANGVRYVPNVAVAGLIDVESTVEGNSAQMPYGSKDGAFYIAGTIEEKTGAPSVKEKSINVMIMGLSAPEPVTFTGTCVYLQGGKEMTEDISGDKGNISKAFWGDCVKSCTVKKTSTNGWFRLTITEDNQTVFRSQKITNQEPVVYEKKQRICYPTKATLIITR